MQGREARVESGEYAGKIRRRHGQANYGATECRLCLGIVMPLGAIFQSIYRKPGSTGFKVGIGLVAQLGASGTVEQRHLRDRTDDQNSLLRNADRHHHVVENLHQNAHGVRKCGGARQAGRSRKAPRKICMSSRSAVAQRAARHQTAGNYHLNLNRHNQQQQCRHQQNARDVTRRVDGMGTVIIQNGTHKKANHARADDKALINNDLVRRHELGHAHIKKILARQKREEEQHQAYNLPNAPTQICGYVSHAPRG